MDAVADARVVALLAVAAQQLDLHVVERVEVGEAVADRALEQRVAVEQFALAGDRPQRLDAGLVLGADAAEDRVAQADAFPEWKPGTEFKAKREQMLNATRTTN